MLERRRISVEGIVQGVGFRPYIHRLATTSALRGFVRNDAGAVVIEVEGESSAVDRFLAQLTIAPPPLATIDRVQLEARTPTGEATFSIATSDDATDRSDELAVTIAPDAATCYACLRELFDPSDRRHRYPFISCSHCGPRLTILDTGPYDRERTSMAPFPMCGLCLAEYRDPSDRRFHAQTNACPECGPRVRFLRTTDSRLRTDDAALSAARSALSAGEIVAVKGLGGFHLACDATNRAAVTRLRARKHRDTKPLAVMVRDVGAARELGVVGDAEHDLLRSPERPIVLLEKAGNRPVLEALAPQNGRIGVMLPYTPLHHLLLADAARPLVMTSGNLHGEPMACDDALAISRLGDVADAFVLHDRRIAMRCDDSVVRARRVEGGASSGAFVRRARGYAPRAIALNEHVRAAVLAVGSHLKNTFCIAYGRSAVVSQHIGDLETPETRVTLLEMIRTYGRLLHVVPRIIAHDRHPDYASTRVANELDADHVVGVQHHHAHVLSCLAEHGVTEPAIGVVFDGAGLGDDGAVWGGELLFAEGARCDRLGHLGYVPLPGGDAAAARPWRVAASHLWNAFGNDETALPAEWMDRGMAGELRLLRQMLHKAVHSPLTSSVGRLFDAVASIAGVCDDARFEGEAAIALEKIAARDTDRAYVVEARRAGDSLIVDPVPIIRGVVADVRMGRSAAEISAAFHNTMCAVVVAMVHDASHRTGVRRVALSGGVFQNALLERLAGTALARLGYEVFMHEKVPCNDGGLSLGQALAATRAVSERR
jgi:hydrogenase maturation protein HypF